MKEIEFQRIFDESNDPDRLEDQVKAWINQNIHPKNVINVILMSHELAIVWYIDDNA